MERGGVRENERKIGKLLGMWEEGGGFEAKEKAINNKKVEKELPVCMYVCQKMLKARV